MTQMNMVQAINDALRIAMRKDERVVVMGEDVGKVGGVFRVTSGLYDEFGDSRVVDTPLSEGGIIGAAVGMALYGMVPVPEIQFSDFIWPAYDQIVSEVAKYRYRSGGEFWAPVGNNSQPYWGRVHDISIDAPTGTAYAATDNGLYAAVSQRPWRWERVINLPNVHHVAQRRQAAGDLLIVATGFNGQNILYRWTPGQTARALASFTAAVQALAADPTPGSGVAAYLLLDSGEVVAVGEAGGRRSLGQRPDWPWEQAFDLLAAPSPNGGDALLLMGHTSGLLHFLGPRPLPAR